MEADKWKLQRGDLLLTEGGDWDKLGRGTVWREEIPNCIHQNHIFRVRTRAEDFIPEFLANLIGSPVGKAYFQGASKQTTKVVCQALHSGAGCAQRLDDGQAVERFVNEEDERLRRP